jgi:hypothetical protein
MNPAKTPTQLRLTYDQTAPPPTDARGPEGTMDAPPEMEASFEEIER